MKYRFFILISIFLVTSCYQQEARRPISSSKTHVLSSAIDLQKNINSAEEDSILKYIRKDSVHQYNQSPNGFWYRYITKNLTDTITPKKGNLVEISYNLVDLKNQIIYSKQEIGIKEYNVDQEDIILGLQKGIKMMKPGETIKFIFPSFNAYGVVGDQNKIGINKTLISIVTLINIK